MSQLDTEERPALIRLLPLELLPIRLNNLDDAEGDLQLCQQVVRPLPQLRNGLMDS